jgi:serine/threonine protein kinase
MEPAETILAEDSGSIVDLLDLIHQRQLERSVTHTSIIDQREANIWLILTTSEEIAKHASDQSFKARLPESFIWHILFHLSAAFARCHHDLGLNVEHYQEGFESSEVRARLRSVYFFDALSNFRHSPNMVAWQSEQLSFFLEALFEPIVHRDIKPSNSEILT